MEIPLKNQLVHGSRITCEIDGVKIDDARISRTDNNLFIIYNDLKVELIFFEELSSDEYKIRLVEEVKVKAFVPEYGGKPFWYFDITNGITGDNYGSIRSKFLAKIGNCFRTKEDAQIAKAKVIELFNSFK